MSLYKYLKKIIYDYSDTIIGTQRGIFTTFSPVSYEVDVRLLCHLLHTFVYLGYLQITVKAVKKDVLIIEMYVFFSLSNLEEL